MSPPAGMGTYQAWREHHLAGVVLAGSVLSIIGSLYMIMGFIVVGLAISDLLLALSFFVPSVSMLLGDENSSPDSRNFCTVNGFFIQFFFLQIDLWQLTIAITTVVFLLWPCSTLDWARERIYVLWIIPWVASLAIGMIAYGVWGYHDLGTYCWLEPPMVRLFFNYIPRWVIIITCLITYGWIFWLIRKVRMNAERERQYRLANTPQPPTVEVKAPITPPVSLASERDAKEPEVTEMEITPVEDVPIFIVESESGSSSSASLASSSASSGPIVFPRCIADDLARAAMATATTVQSSTFGVPAASTVATSVAATIAPTPPPFDEEEHQRRQVRKIAIQLISFPLATALLWTVPTAVMIYQVIHGADSVNVHVDGFAQMLLVFNGFVDAHIYGFNERTAMGWKERIRGGGRYNDDVQEMPGRAPAAPRPSTPIPMADMSRTDGRPSDNNTHAHTDDMV
ncbi:hypothetical protein Dda_9126 [Drechslerella dactyloides]|uniref:Glucose receptor Git3-like N-terminal domain-containing protein n=1 Tax=Drechslerella dactyloides TaxID=74499 RepID=A0AAD6IPM1_DREDA|nr:hypothetical protein Dda_9126 [Drechslerella dactyloides]